MSHLTESDLYGQHRSKLLKIFSDAGIQTAGMTLNLKPYKTGNVLFITLPSSGESKEDLKRWDAADRALRAEFPDRQTAFQIKCGIHHTTLGPAAKRFNSGRLEQPVCA